MRRTYNAITLSGKTVDFCKLATEFELNALLILEDRCLGSDPYKIKNYFVSRDILNYTVLYKSDFTPLY